MSCSAEQIAEKKRLALERLKQRQVQSPASNAASGNAVSVPAKPVTQPTIPKPANGFYGSSTASVTAELKTMESKIKSQGPYKNTNRILSQPYPGRDPKEGQKQEPSRKTPFLPKIVTCTCSMVTSTYFQVVTSGYHPKIIEVFKTIPSRKYSPDTKIWSFNIKDYDIVRERIGRLNPDVVIGTIPKFVLNLLKNSSETETNYACLSAIEPTLTSALLSFQKDGVCFGIEKGGRCMIADDMGLGKTYQALAIADFYKDDWPLLICTTAATRDTWAEQIRKLLPWVPCQHIVTLTSTSDYYGDAKVLIVSYPLMERNRERLLEKKFGFIILDESHLLKNYKSKSTDAATHLAGGVKRVVLLTGTPALSRPSELFSQLKIIDPSFFNFKDYSIRYCAGKEGPFGLDSSGQSNLQELKILLGRKFMIRRTKEQVEFQLKEKSRETIMLDKDTIWKCDNDEMKDTVENMKEYSDNFQKLQGRQREEVLLRFYNETARVKARAVCAYLKNLVREEPVKFIVFAHHQVMMNAISDCLGKLKVNCIRIDGTTKNDLRTAYVKKFQTKDSCRAAVLSLKACNAGITLTAANLVIFAELDWNPSTLAQAEARAHRIGQTEEVTCRYLLAQGTADDIIWEMLKKKQDTLNKAGLFSEDLSDATHSFADISTNSSSVKDYFSPSKPKESQPTGQPKPSTSKDQTDTNVVNANEQKSDEGKENEFASLLDDDEDMDFLELDF